MIRRNERIRRTGDYYVRCEYGSMKYYRAVLEVGIHRIRISRRAFKTASGALAYRHRFDARWARLRSMVGMDAAALAE